MTDEERTIITQFIERVSGAARPASSVPATITPLPPVDPEADRLIGSLFERYPEARYRLTQTAFVQEHALAEAQSRIAQLQQQLQQQQAAPTPAPQQGGGFFRTLFGDGSQAAAPPVQPQPYQAYPPQGQPGPPPNYAPQYAPPPQYAPQFAPAFGAPQSMVQRSGSGFLGSALTTAAGVAGGMVAGNALMNLFEGHHGYGGGFGGSSFGGPGFDGGYQQGGFEQGGGWEAPMQNAQVTGGAWDNAQETSQPGGWDQPAADSGDGGGGGGWDDGGSNNGTL